MLTPAPMPDGNDEMRDELDEEDADDGVEREERRPWQFSLRQLLWLTTLVAVACGLTAWWGMSVVLAIVGAAAGVFVVALTCPWIGCDVVLDDLRVDVVKCLGVGGYLVGGAWGLVAGIKGLMAQAFSAESPVHLTGGLILCYLFTVGLVAKLLWSHIDSAEATLLTVGALVGSFTMLMIFA